MKEQKHNIKYYILKIWWILFGTMLLGLGIAIQTISSLGADSLSSMTFSFVYLMNLKWFNFSFCYFIINFVFFIIMLFTLRRKIHIGTILNFVLTGAFCDIFLLLFSLLNVDINNIAIRIIIGLLGIVVASFGIALYAGANFGLAPYDALPIIITKKVSKLKFKYAKILTDLMCAVVAFIIGILILERNDIISINTILSFVLMGPVISLFSNVLSKTLFKDEDKVFN